MMADLAVTAVDVSFIGTFRAIRQILYCAVVIETHPSSAGTAEKNTRQQGRTGAAQAARAITRRGGNAFLQNLFTEVETEIINNSQMFKGFGKLVSKANLSNINRIAHDRSYRRRPPECARLAALCLDSPFIQPVGNAICSPAFRNDLIIDLLDDGTFRFVDHQIANRLVLFVGASQMLQTVSEGYQSSAVQPFLNHL